MKLKQNLHGGNVTGNLTLIRQGFFDIFRFGGGGDICPTHPTIFVVCGPVATKFCARIDNQSIRSSMEKMHKVKDVIDNDVIIARKLAKKTVKRV